MSQKLSLLDIVSTFEEKIQNKMFCYTLSNSQTIRIAIYQEQICHLLGIQYVFGHDKRYLGAKGYQSIKSENITIDSLKKHNLKQYNYIKERLLYFDKLYEILTKGQLIKFYNEKAFPYTKIEADFIVIKNGQKHIYHLFLRQEKPNDNLYSAISFIVKSIDEKYPKQYIDHQEYKKIEKIEIHQM